MTKRFLLSILITLGILLISNNVNAMKIVLDPGHGGTDKGAIGYNDIYEKDVNLKIGLYLKEYLNKYKDVDIVMTRESDSYSTIYERGIIARQNKPDIFISLHNNAMGNIVNETEEERLQREKDTKGVEVYVTSSTDLPKYQEETSKLAQKIVENIASLGIENRGVKISPTIKEENHDYYYRDKVEGTEDEYIETPADYYGIIRYAMRGCRIDDGVIVEGTYNDIRDGSGIPTVLIEHCYLKGDNSYIDSDADLQRLAEADGKAIVEYYKLELKGDEEILVAGDVITKPTGVYQHSYNDELNVPVISFKLHDEKDKITGNDIKKEFTCSEINYKDKKIKSNEILKNSSIIEIDGKNYTVLIYGDANCDGSINIIDIITILNYVKGKINFNEIENSASDVNRSGKTDILDVIRLLNVLKGKVEYNQL